MTTARDSAIDAIKGLLVIGMLVVHASTLFMDSRELRLFIYPGLLGFVSGSWVFLSGFIVGTHYRQAFASNPRVVARRLVSRGSKLLAIFVLINAVLGRLSLACPATAGMQGCDPLRLLLLGPEGEYAFEIIFGIGYVLVVSPLFLRWPGLAAWLTGALILAGTVAHFLFGQQPALVWMLACGAAGIVLGGFVPHGDVARVFDASHARRIAALLAAFTVCGYLWLRANHVVGSVSTLFFVSYVTGALVLMYLASAWLLRRGDLYRELDVMARYSLVAYMGQMAVLQVVHALVPELPYLAALVVALACTLFCLHAIDYLRGRFILADRAYRTIFA